MTRYSCCDDLRRNAVAAHALLNGIDYLEVLDSDAPNGQNRQRTLLVRALKVLPELGRDNVALSGGERVRNVGVVWAARADLPPASTTAAERAYFAKLREPKQWLLVRTDAEGDHSPYRLRLQRSPSDARLLQGFDPLLSEVAFTFKAECDSDFDCASPSACAEAPVAEPELDYLAKDYDSFRRLMRDRVAQLVPSWSERSAADLGMTLIELVAYAGDQLSYFQDAVATEAYLSTARKRSSMRRHALLVDYALDEGSNARCFVQLVLASGVTRATVRLDGLRFLTRVPGASGRIPDDPANPDFRAALAVGPLVFEPLEPSGLLSFTGPSVVTLHEQQHAMSFYTWGDQRCCLAAGATRATLLGHLSSLRVGDVIIFEEVRGPSTGLAEDADPTRRHAVRLTEVDCSSADNSQEPLTDPLPARPVAITEIAWAEADALPFSLCLSSRTDEEHGARLVDGICVARGNIVLADHGATEERELAKLPGPTRSAPRQPRDRCKASPEPPPRIRYRPVLPSAPLTQTALVHKRIRSGTGTRTERRRFDSDGPATQRVPAREDLVVPAVQLRGQLRAGGGVTEQAWEVQPHLLDSAAGDRHFVVEVEHDQRATLRFGDGVHGGRVDGTERFLARYRVGMGVRGNIGADALAHVVSDDAALSGARNPLPARGGREPETAAQIRRRAPHAFQRLERAVTPADYATVTERSPDVQRAAATPRWTGSWHTMFVTVDRQRGGSLDANQREQLRTFVERYRMAGHDVAFQDPIAVPLEIELLVCVAAGAFRSDVRRALLDVLSNRLLSDGRRGMFHPDVLSFGTPVYLSRVYATARSVPGVEMVEATAFARQGQAHDARPLREGVLRFARLEVPQLDNDRNYPERGVLRLSLHGGK